MPGEPVPDDGGGLRAANAQLRAMSPALECDAEDLGAAAAQPCEGQHIIGHLSRVTPCGWPGSLTLSVPRLSNTLTSDPSLASLVLEFGKD